MSLLLATLAALAPATDPEPPARKFTATFTKPQDTFSASVEKSVPVWKIDSKSGIGGATVTLAAGPSAKTIVIRFAGLRNLEMFRVEVGDLKLSGSADRKRAAATYHFDDTSKRLDGPKGAAASITVEYAKDGMEVVLTLAKPAKQWKLNWIDAYRR